LTVFNNKYRKLIDTEIKKIEKRIHSTFVNRQPKSLYEPCEYILRGGGKRLRPLLVLVSASAVNGNFKDVYNAAIATELLHNFTLAHDDIMDNSNLRRGKSTLHRKYDLSTAILTGDSLLALAYATLLKDVNANSKNIVSTFTKGLIEVCEGQSLDKEFELRKNVTLKEYKVMIYKKTASLIVMCCSIGAQICNASKDHVNAVSTYGRYLGMAFQIQDDLLDIIAEEKEFGKKIGSDLIEGKKTFLLLRALEKAKGKDKSALMRIFNNKGIDESEVEKYRELYTRLNVIKDAEHEIAKYIKLALGNLSSLPDSEGKALMQWTAKILMSRKK
jgi:geranylgeranyl diphosphate synthase, type II